MDGIAALAGGVDPNVLKKLKELEIENKNLKKGTQCNFPVSIEKIILHLKIDTIQVDLLRIFFR